MVAAGIAFSVLLYCDVAHELCGVVMVQNPFKLGD